MEFCPASPFLRNILGDGNKNQNDIEDLLDTKLVTNFDTEEEDLPKLESNCSQSLPEHLCNREGD